MKKEATTKTPEEDLNPRGQNGAEGSAANETTTAQKKSEKSGEPVMYIGPNNLREGLQRYQVFKARPTERMTSLKEKYPHIELMFVPIVRLGAALEEVTKKGTLRSVAYNEVLEVEA